MRRIVRMVRELGPKSIHVAVFSPPVRYPCFYGIDMPSNQELIAADGSDEDRLAAAFGADSVTYISLDGLKEVIGSSMCSACFDNDYVVPLSATERMLIQDDRRPNA
jgi:amidophosphoribosyltransferase